jgi:CheY-like chemotaxis protein
VAHVLVVDDDRYTRDALRLALEDAGHAVMEAADGESALAVLGATSDGLVVLLDQMMPKMTGLDVLHAAARDVGLARRHAYVLLTASPHLGRAHLDALDGQLHVALVAKPFDLDVLLEAVEQAAQRLAG